MSRMFRPATGRHQVTIKLLPGAEPWLLVTHPLGSFKLPAEAACGELLRGVCEAWSGSNYRARTATPMVRVPLSEWLALSVQPAPPPLP